MMSPTLYVVATPIGNMQDISLRALDVLRNVDYIVSEDTRQTVKLLNKYEIKKEQISYRDENHLRVYPRIIELLKSGHSLALTSDSGTPLISDPGFKLIQEAIKHNINLVPIPGPSAVITALSVSGIPTDKFIFLGFLPRKDGPKLKLLEEYGNLDCTMVIYESPYRVTRLLKDIHNVLGDRYIFVAKELTKVYETKFYGKASTLIQSFGDKKLKGEYVVLIAKKDFDGQ